MDSVLARNWGMIALRGVVAILFGVIAILNPAAGLAVLILLFGALAFADGVLAIVAAIAIRNGEQRWLALLVSGILAIVVGLIAFTRPALTTVVLVYLVAAWAIVAGVGEIAAAIRLRRVITDEWLLLLTGVLSVGFGIGLALFPGAGALALIIWIGALAVVIGALRVVVAMRLRAWRREAGREAG